MPVLFVHGAWHGAWCWEPALTLLAGRGVQAGAVDLPGHGDDTGPLGDLHGDAEAVAAALDKFDVPGLLVGHSYGGIVVTEAGTHPAVAELLYIAAFNLDAGESAMSAATSLSDALDVDHAGRPDALASLQVDDAGVSTVEPGGARVLFYNDCTDDVADWAVARLGSHPMSTMRQTPAAVAWRQRPSKYAVCTRDNVVHPAIQRALAARVDHTVEWDTSHSPFLSRPELVADEVVAIVRRLSST